MESIQQFTFDNELQHNQGITLFQEQLVYGIQLLYYNKYKSTIEMITCYLHEKYINLIIFINDKGIRRLYDLKKIKIHLNNTKYSSVYNLKNQIILNDGFSEEILIFPNYDSKFKFYKDMQALISKYRHTFNIRQSYAMQWFIEADANCDYKLTYHEIFTIFEKLKLKPNLQLKRIFQSVKKHAKIQTNALSIEEFEQFTKILFCKIQVKKIFEKYIKSKRHKYYSELLIPCMTKLQFEIFARVEQFQSMQNSKIISSKLFGNKQKISFYDFSCYIFSSHNLIFNKKQKNKIQTQDKPLNQYFCFSSHNTYLSGNQLTSDSKVQRFLEDLEDGIRCVELDIHDDGDIPIVKHRYTATSTILFKDVIKAVANFSNQNYNHTPIILSLENHCNIKNQQRMTKILLEYFQDPKTGNSKLLKIDVNQIKYPKLSQLRNKIIIKCTGRLENLLHNIDEVDIEEEQQKEQIYLSPQKNNLEMIESKPIKKRKQQFEKFVKKLSNQKLEFELKKKKFISYLKNQNFSGKTKISQELLHITTMLSSGVFGEFSCWQSISLSETKFRDSYIRSKDTLILHTKNSWIRSYPGANRINSSNYNPLPMFEAGVQIVALNTQNKDIYTNLLYSMFLKNKKQLGYKLKPIYLREDEINNNNNKQIEEKLTIRIKIISCHAVTLNQLSQQIPLIQVNIAFFGAQTDMKVNANSGVLLPFTQTIENNSYNPIFDKAIQFVCTVKKVFFAFICFEIKNCGLSVIPVRLMRTGYRLIPLYDDLMQEKGSYILANIKIET